MFIFLGIYTYFYWGFFSFKEKNYFLFFVWLIIFIFLRFDSKKTSDLFISKLKEKNYENINTLLEKPIKDCDNNIIPIYELSESERKNYLNIVKEKIENYKKNKEKIKNNKETIKNE